MCSRCVLRQCANGTIYEADKYTEMAKAETHRRRLESRHTHTHLLPPPLLAQWWIQKEEGKASGDTFKLQRRMWWELLTPLRKLMTTFYESNWSIEYTLNFRAQTHAHTRISWAESVLWQISAWNPQKKWEQEIISGPQDHTSSFPWKKSSYTMQLLAEQSSNN